MSETLVAVLATAVLVGGPLLIVAAYYANQASAARRTLQRVLDDVTAQRDRARAPQVNNQRRGTVLPIEPTNGDGQQ